MHPSVRAAWVDFNTPLEGIVPTLYADVKGLITIGMGNLVDPIEYALKLPFITGNGTSATQVQIAAAWRAVKSDPACATRGWRYAASVPFNFIHLSPESIDALILSKLDANDAVVGSVLPGWESMPADAQLAVHSMAWAMGPHFFDKFPHFTAALKVSDYVTAAIECAISPAVGTVVERNRRNKQCFLDANGILRTGGDPSTLCWSSPTV